MAFEEEAEKQFNVFKNWSRLFDDGSYSEESFRRYLKSDDPLSKIKTHIQRRIFEMKYGYKFIWSYENNKMEVFRPVKK